jgi:lysophospholipase L1-like esterase
MKFFALLATVISIDLSLPKIILMGDSITEMGFKNEVNGYISILQDRYVRKADIINRGYSGYNTEWYKYLVPDILEGERNVKAVVLFLGANDAVLAPGKQHVPLKQYRSNLLEMGNRILNSTRLILVTPPPVDRKINDRSFENTLKYRTVVLEVAQQLQVPVVDTYVTFLGNVEYNQKLLDQKLIDGLHFNAQGNREYEYQVLLKLMEIGLDPNRIKGKVVRWDEVDSTKLPSSLYY